MTAKQKERITLWAMQETLDMGLHNIFKKIAGEDTLSMNITGGPGHNDILNAFQVFPEEQRVYLCLKLQQINDPDRYPADYHVKLRIEDFSTLRGGSRWLIIGILVREVRLVLTSEEGKREGILYPPGALCAVYPYDAYRRSGVFWFLPGDVPAGHSNSIKKNG